MADVTVRQVHGQEMLRAMYAMHAYAFGSSPPLRDRAEREESLLRRQGATHMAVYEGDEPMACGASRPLIQQVRGALYPMAGLLDVTTHPAARRKGYARKLLLALLEAVREGGAACSGLYPFRESFYERLGYVTLPQTKRARLDPSALQPLLRRDWGGQVRMLPIEEGYDAYRAFLEGQRRRVHGMALFEPDDRFEARRNTQWLALASVGEQVEGVMLYDLRGEQIARYNLRASRFCYRSAVGRYLLLEWIARHIDQADRAEIMLPAYERPEGWLADLKLQIETAGHITPMVRVLDIERMAGMATGPGAVTVRLADPVCPWNEGAWRLATVDGRLEITRAQEAQGSLTIQGFTALAYGTHDPAEFGLRGWGALDEAAQETLRAMFPLRSPHLHEQF
jgi:predicted acetyltransferase